MAASPTRPRSAAQRPPLPLAVRQSPLAGAALFADVVSFGFVATAIIAVTAFDIQLGVIQVLAVMALFGGLRYVAHELRVDAHEAALVDARRVASLRAASPRRWSVEQRDGLGRRFDGDA